MSRKTLPAHNNAPTSGAHLPPIEIDTRNLYTEYAGAEGIRREELEALAPEIDRVFRQVRDGSAHGLDAEFACLDLGHTMPAELATIRGMAETLRGYHDIVLIGIGGSSLGTKAIAQAVADKPRSAPPHMHYVENVDPYYLERGVVRAVSACLTTGLC